MDFDIKNNSNRLCEINVTPLVDVMLVLMIIFLVTAPLMKYSVEIEMPKTSQKDLLKKNEPVNLIIDSKGKLYWNDKAISKKELKENLASFDKEAVLQIVADKKTQYDAITDILVEARINQINNIGFVIEQDK